MSWNGRWAKRPRYVAWSAFAAATCEDCNSGANSSPSTRRIERGFEYLMRNASGRVYIDQFTRTY